MKRSDFAGLEFDWFARDADGFVALLSSAGWGPVPDAVFEHYEAQMSIERALCNLCGISELADIPRGFQALLHRGLFAYDWHKTYGPYRRFGVPTTPTLATDLALPPDVSRGLILLQVNGVDS